MKIIFARSPYIITINPTDAIETRLDVFLYNRPTTTPPVNPTYTLTQGVLSLLNRDTFYDVSNYAIEYIDNIAPYTLADTDTDKMWCYMRTTKYKRIVANGVWIQVGVNEDFIVVNGYTDYMDGVNKIHNFNSLPLTMEKKTISGGNLLYEELTQTIPDSVQASNPYVDILIENNTTNVWQVYRDATLLYAMTFSSGDGVYIKRVPLNTLNPTTGAGTIPTSPYTLRVVRTGLTLWSRKIIPECNTKYKPVCCSFICRDGGWENIWFLRAKEESITSSSTEYNFQSASINYDVQKGQTQTFNVNGKKSVKLNTGWGEESFYSRAIEQMLMSETVLLDNVPVLVKSKNFTLKNHLKDKNINYEVEFEYKFGIINDVV